jgi:phosphomannomutase
MTQHLLDSTPADIAGEKLLEVSTLDGVKYILADDSWLLIRPSGTEPVLRVYAEGRTPEMVRAMIGFGEQVAASIT